MKRREFLLKSSISLTALATSDKWLSKVIAGEPIPSQPSLLDAYFQVSRAEINKVLADCLAKGAEFADVFFERRISSNLSFEDDRIRSAGHGITLGVGIRALKGDQMGFAFSEDLTLAAMMEAAKTAAEIAADKNTKRRIQPLQPIKPENFYPIIQSATSAESSKKLSIIEEANQAAKTHDPRVVKVSIRFNDEMRHVAYANSNGLYCEDSQPLFIFRLTCIAEEGKMRETGYARGGGRVGLEYFDKRKPAEFGKEAARIATMNLAAKEVEAGAQTVVLGNAESGVLLHEGVGHGLEADYNYKKLSNFSGRVGEKVASDICTVVDEGSIKNQRGSINIDNEGVLPSPTVLIENGVLRRYLTDRVSAKQLGMKLTGNGRRESYNYPPLPRMTNIYMRPGKYAPEEIIKSVKKGIYAKDYAGGNVDTVRGDFTFGCSECYLIEDGVITAPLRGVTLIGNGPEVMKKITMVGNDLKFSEAGWTCGKYDQYVPVGIGMPTVKVSEITVGGTKVKA